MKNQNEVRDRDLSTIAPCTIDRSEAVKARLYEIMLCGTYGKSGLVCVLFQQAEVRLPEVPVVNLLLLGMLRMHHGL
jgi:hypothetical protein